MKAITLPARDEAAYARRGCTHDLVYYDGPILSAQMCVAAEDTHVVEVAVDGRAAETDGYMVYLRLSREDLQCMLRILDEDPVETPKHCGQSPSGVRGPCPSCHPESSQTADST
jgi:hypothetical protein